MKSCRKRKQRESCVTPPPQYRRSRWCEYISLDGAASAIQQRIVSDGGLGAQRIVSACDRSAREERRRRRVRVAIDFVLKAAPELAPTLEMILKNGKDKEESICQMAHGKLRRRRR